MTKQLQKLGVTDKRYCYKADGIFINSIIKDFEILLMEVSGEYSNGDQAKISFDHYKASFGLQSMLTSIAQEILKSSWDTFKR
ncbi:hypothetical protein BDF20DRAFT_816439 [Mycotypha africana]|uniref:uncharacterized protein n=1 Tax=Mycotypha africana TaxID=64632 RepID=UPI002301DC27|nr:uncharacterized protein BDF20DRAFT_816439 [Mycotypha africana]KAI8984153.1 hypothetical protein BDF20DRAFT_816439 [Mycotypha africana]